MKKIIIFTIFIFISVINFNVVHIGPADAGAPKYGDIDWIPNAIYFCFKTFENVKQMNSQKLLIK